MADPNDMRFYALVGSAVPVGPKALHTYRGRPRKVYDLAGASRLSGWPPTALIALHEATYPSAPVETGDWSEGWVDELAEAMFHDPRVRIRLGFHARTIGLVPPGVFLIALLDSWDAGDTEAKQQDLLDALGVKMPDANLCPRDGGKGADHD